MLRYPLLLVIGFIVNTASYAQVNLQSGAAEQAFPLINYLDAKAGLSLNVGMAYSSGNGLLVNDIASDVGTGWNLDAGGVVMRVQNGEPDDQKEYDSQYAWAYADDQSKVKEVLKNYPNGYMYHNNQGCNVGLRYYPVFKKAAVYKELNIVASDMEQDKFVFRMGGHAGAFVIGKNWQTTTIGDSKAKITFSTEDMTSQGIRTTINQFVITTEDGLKYTFKDKSLSHICRYKYSTKNSKGEWVPLTGNPGSGAYEVGRYYGYPLEINERPYVINAWFLSEIENTNTKQKIYFNYQDIKTDIITSKLINHQRNLNSLKGMMDKNMAGRIWWEILNRPGVADKYSWDTEYLNQIEPGPTSIFYNRSIQLSKRISSISLPNGGTINFIYSTTERLDLPGEHALANISYVLNNKLIRGYNLTYGYFYKNAIRSYDGFFKSLSIKIFDRRFTRLCLLSVQKTGTGEDNAGEPPYRFSYYTGSTISNDDIVPAQNYLSQDHWGYYNGNNSGLSLTENHDFLTDERNQYFKTVLPKYKNPKSGYAKNGLLKSLTFPTGGTIEYYYEQNRPSHNILPTQYEQLAGGVSVSKTIMFDGEDHNKDIIKEYAYISSSGQSSKWGDEAPNYYSFSSTDNVEKWGHKTFKYPGISYPEMATSIDMGKVWGKALLSMGLNIGLSIGISFLPAAIIPVVNVFLFAVTTINLIVDASSTVETSRLILCNINNMLANPLLPYCSRVEVKTNSPTGYNGKTVFEFTDLVDYPAIVPKLEWPYIQNQRLATWQYGLLKKMSAFDKDGNLVDEVVNNYHPTVLNTSMTNNANCKCAIQSRQSFIAYDWDEKQRAWFTTSEYGGWLKPRPYLIYTGRTDLLSTVEKIYNKGSLVFTNTTSVTTDPMTLLQKGKIIQKDVNSVILQLTYYPTDYNIPGSALEKLKQANAIHAPVATESWLLKVDYNFQFGLFSPHFTLDLLNANVTEYKEFTFGTRQEIKPWRTYQLKSKMPVSSSVIGMQNSSVLLRKPELFKVQNEMVYDDDGNLVQTISDDNITSFVNDYSSRYAVATVANASYSDIAYSSFESNGKGSWSFDPAFITEESGGVTGTKSIYIGNNPSISTLPSTLTRQNLDGAKTYVVTYWIKSGTGQVTVNGNGGELLFQSGDWQLYKAEVSGSTQATIAGSGTIDEVRMYPKGALMSTVAYKEGIGKTADCDANNRLLFYEYDALGRLKLIRDQNRNVVKTYEYNYKK